jgi:hypothetical protein
MLKLMAYADGELEGAELEEAQKLLASDPDSVRFVEQIAGLGEIVSQGHRAGAGKTVAKFDVVDSVMALTKESAREKDKVTSIGEARSAKKAQKGSGGNGVKIGAGIAAALALAASFFLFAQHRTDEAPMASNNNTTPAVQAVQPSGASNANANATVAAVSTTGGSGVTVSAVDSPGSSVSVFYLPTANQLSTSVVVWVDETGEK